MDGWMDGLIHCIVNNRYVFFKSNENKTENTDKVTKTKQNKTTTKQNTHYITEKAK